MILGAVLAGGQSSRFGSDKALAQWGGRSLLSRAVETLSGLSDAVVIVGRESGEETGDTPCIPDWPKADMGPLGGIAGALSHAATHHFTSVITCGVDSAELPKNLAELLAEPPAYLESQPVIGHWKSDAASTVQAILQSEGRHSMIALAQATNARAVKLADIPANINTPADLAAVEKRNGI